MDLGVDLGLGLDWRCKWMEERETLGLASVRDDTSGTREGKEEKKPVGSDRLTPGVRPGMPPALAAITQQGRGSTVLLYCTQYCSAV